MASRSLLPPFTRRLLLKKSVWPKTAGILDSPMSLSLTRSNHSCATAPNRQWLLAACCIPVWKVDARAGLSYRADMRNDQRSN
jgi:hypothetical protein